MSVNPTGIPEELRALPQWVVWRNDAGRKVPYQTNGKPASSTDPATWTTFERALLAAAKFTGIGFVLVAPYCGVDLDDCMDRDGNPHDSAARLVSMLASYTEVSPSGTGLHVIVKARKPGPKSKRDIPWTTSDHGKVELYDDGRYFCMTGEVSPDAPAEVMDRQEQIDDLYRRLWPDAPAPKVTTAPITDAAERCWKYLLKCPDSISGRGGHDHALRAACESMRFGLSDAEAFGIMRKWSDEKSGGEPWNDREMAHKLADARAKVQAAGEIGIRLRDNPAKLNGHAKIVAPPATGAAAELGTRFDRIAKGEYAAASWCWPATTNITQSLLPGTVTLLCGKPGDGKSFWMLAAAMGWLEAGTPFALFELEEDRTYHITRLLAMLEGDAKVLDLGWVKDHPAEAKAAMDRHAGAIDAMGRAIYDAPESRVSLSQLADWYEDVAAKVRVAVIDPVTAASAGERRWLEDGAFMERIKTTARKTETSVVLVTHPRIGNRKSISLDDLAGGADYARFSQTVMVLAGRTSDEPVHCHSPFGRRTETANRMLHIRKARNGTGGGCDIAFKFDGKTLAFSEVGVVIG